LTQGHQVGGRSQSQPQRQSLRGCAGKGRPKITDVSRLVKLYEEGYSTIDLAKMFGVTPQAIWTRLRALNKTRNRSEAQRVRYQRKGVKLSG
jgi:transposase